MTSFRVSFKDNSFQMSQFPYQPLKKVNSAFDKTGLLLQTALESEAKSLLPTFQFDYSWTVEMSDRQNDWFAKPSDSLDRSLSTLCTSQKLFSGKCFLNEQMFKVGIVKNVVILYLKLVCIIKL